MKKTLLLSVFATLAIPSTSFADFDSAEGDRIVLSLGGGFGGGIETEIDTRLGNVTANDDLDASFVLGARYEMSVARFLLLGLGFGYTRYEPEDDDRRSQFLDLTVMPTFAGAIDVGRLTLEPRFGLAIGPSMHVYNEDYEDGLDALGLTRTSFGFHLGVLPGLGFDLGGFGFLFEMGYMHHRVYDGDDNDNDYQLRTGQMIVQVGFQMEL